MIRLLSLLPPGYHQTMPLYDYHCRACASDATLLMRASDPAVCPACGSQDMERRYAPFAIGGSSHQTKTPAKDGVSASHDHAHDHSHSPTSSSSPTTASGCAAHKSSDGPGCQGGYVESVLKKYTP